jgi:hypothetical protein
MLAFVEVEFAGLVHIEYYLMEKYREDMLQR